MNLLVPVSMAKNLSLLLSSIADNFEFINFFKSTNDWCAPWVKLSVKFAAVLFVLFGAYDTGGSPKAIFIFR